uniref:Fibronectin type III domain-containing protein n=1 Tax=Candidatus Kentrum eta TaxID=2126337 RepID=A0A450UIA6_9GAMM|nr:MAG: Fibronectin type III domain-containing protein [Candidatus Kentron sp. H]VFJ93201.1 MAG: Fibronectin type III domain-containing protein [Candidatus Kentron sp. H]VFK00041.1 MAG: Fibronectin type III domain-containing protein [Candidatus Kentron sp. H]
MAQFPRDETGIIGLAQEIADGLAANTETYPAPPVPIEDLNAALAACVVARDTVQAAKSALEEAVHGKQAVFETLAERMKKEIRYAENVVDYDDAKLKSIGWGGRGRVSSLAPPGRARGLAIRRQGAGSITLGWEKPTDGGKVAAYKVKRRARAEGGVWSNVETAMATEATLTGQIQGKELEFCVAAMNKAGEGLESNTVTAVL